MSCWQSKHMRMKLIIPSAQWQPFCLGLNLLNGMTLKLKCVYLRAPCLHLCVCIDCDGPMITVSHYYVIAWDILLLRLRRKLLRSSTRMRLPILNSVRAWARLFHVSASRGLRPIAAEPQSAQGGTMEQSSRWWAKICHFGEVGHWSRSLAAFFFRKFLGD